MLPRYHTHSRWCWGPTGTTKGNRNWPQRAQRTQRETRAGLGSCLFPSRVTWVGRRLRGWLVTEDAESHEGRGRGHGARRTGPPQAASGMAGSDPGGTRIAPQTAQTGRPRDAARAFGADAHSLFRGFRLSSVASATRPFFVPSPENPLDQPFKLITAKTPSGAARLRQAKMRRRPIFGRQGRGGRRMHASRRGSACPRDPLLAAEARQGGPGDLCDTSRPSLASWCLGVLVVIFSSQPARRRPA